MTPFTVLETTFKGHSRSSSKITLSGLSITHRKSRLHFIFKVAEMTLKVYQGHWWWHNSISHIILLTLQLHLIIIIIISKTIFMILSSLQSHFESLPGLLDKCRMAPSGRRPSDQARRLGSESACTGCQKLHPPSPFIIITQSESWYSFTVPRRVEGWVVGWLHTEMVYQCTDGYPSWY